jgi:hypothetical protein
MKEYILIIGAFLAPVAVAAGAWTTFVLIAWVFLGDAR